MQVTTEIDRSEVASLAGHSWAPNFPGLERVPDAQQVQSRPGRVVAIWPDSAIKSHAAVRVVPTLLVPDAEMREFLAWINTYAGLGAPLTSLVRVMDSDEFTLWSLLAREQSSSGRDETAVLAWATAAVCEALGHAKSRDRQSPLSRSAIESTLARALGATVCNAAIQLEVSSRVEHAWRSVVSSSFTARAREAEPGSLGSSGLDFFLTSCDWLRHFWREATDERLSRSPVSVALRDIAGAMGARRLPAEVERQIQELDHSSSLGSRERQVMGFDQLVRIARTSTLSRDAMDLVVGYAASSVAPGSLQHVRLVVDDPAASVLAVWAFGVFSFMRNPLAALTFGGSLPLRIGQGCMGIASTFDPVSADVGVAEYKMLMERDIATAQFSTQIGGRLLVELVPGVDMPTRMQNESAQREITSQQTAVSTLHDVRQHAIEILHLLDQSRSAESPRTQESLWDPPDAGAGRSSARKRRRSR